MAIFNNFPGGGGAPLDKIALALLSWRAMKYSTATDTDSHFYGNTNYLVIKWGIFVFAVFKNCWYKRDGDNSYRSLSKGYYMVAADYRASSGVIYYFHKLNSDAEIQAAMECDSYTDAQNIGTAILDFSGRSLSIFANKT